MIMKKLFETSGDILYRYPFIPAAVLSFIAVLALGVLCDAAELPRTAHTFLTGPAGAVSEPSPSRTSQGFDREALAYATHRALKADHSQQTYEDVRAIALLVIDAADRRGIDPFVALAVVIQESRFSSVKGDGGHACGMAQQHARFSIKWENFSTSKTVREECGKLMTPQYAAEALAEHLHIIQSRRPDLRKYVYAYNSRWDQRGEIWWHEHFKWRCYVEEYYDRRVHAKQLSAALASDLKGSYAWWKRTRTRPPL